MKKYIWALFIVTLVACDSEPKSNSTDNALSERLNKVKKENAKSINLEATIKTIFVLDEAIKNVKDVNEYKEYLYKFDMSGVAPEVVECFIKLVPILDNLYDSEIEKEINESLWLVFSELNDVEQTLINAGTQLVAKDYMGAALTALQARNDARKIGFKRYKKDLEIQKKIRDINNDYHEYLKFSSPIFLKYMSEWDKICAQRDQAYISLYNSNYNKVLEFSEEALKISSTDREATLLKGFSLLKLNNFDTGNSEGQLSDNIEIQNLLDNYFNNFPKSTAPAFILKGMFEYKKGDIESAMTSFDEASILYPKQAEELLDLANIFNIRSSIFRSVESEFISKSYMSMMEGFGNFSPNFQKAIIHNDLGNTNKALEEIKRHFFRRGNQVVQDYLPGDLNFCNKYLTDIFSKMFVEHPFVDIEVSKGSIIDPKNSLRVKMINNSDRFIENVRLFLCIHFTDTYKDSYQVFRVPDALNNLDAFSEKKFDEPLVVNYKWLDSEKEVPEDIVRVRGVIITDDIVSWIDEEGFKFKEAQENFNKYGIENTNFSSEMLQELNQAKVLVDRGYVYNDITFSITKKIIEFDPYVTINNINSINPIRPSEKLVDGNQLVYKFRTRKKIDELKDILLVTNQGSLNIPIPKK
jgi:tetratricopeptide (TPR) repeat protein